jgi:chromosome segregation ATPase
MSELIKKIDSLEATCKALDVQVKEKSDALEVERAATEAAKQEKAKAESDLTAARVELEAAQKAIEAHKAELATARAEIETIKARLALTGIEEKGKGDAAPAGVAVASEAGKVDHSAAYRAISDPRERAEYRAKFAKELGLKKQ